MPIKGANWYNWMLISDSEGCSMVMSLPTIPTNFGTLNFMSYFLKASSVKMAENRPKHNLADGNRLPVFLYLGHRGSTLSQSVVRYPVSLL